MDDFWKVLVVTWPSKFFGGAESLVCKMLHQGHFCICVVFFFCNDYQKETLFNCSIAAKRGAILNPGSSRDLPHRFFLVICCDHSENGVLMINGEEAHPGYGYFAWIMSNFFQKLRKI